MIHTTPTRRTTCDQWAIENRVYPPSAGLPGPRDPFLTPYVIDPMRAFDLPEVETVVFLCASQMGKTEMVLDVIGHRLDQRPVPTLYIGPSQSFIMDEVEPRIMDLIRTCRSLMNKMGKGKANRQFRKVIAGVQLRFAWAGSPTQLAGMSAGLAIVDELDRMLKNVKGEGDPFEMIKARGSTYRDRKQGVTSTPLMGNIETYLCENSNLQFWQVMEPIEVESPIWRLFQQGTMHHWAWPCPMCDEFFIPRFDLLNWPEDATPADALDSAYIACPHCGGVIEEHHKPDLNKRGVYVAPGQRVQKDGTVLGEPKKSRIVSYWASGLCSPFETIGERTQAYLLAKESEVPEKIQGVINTKFGECWSPAGGDAPQWEEVYQLRQPIQMGDVPDWVQFITAGIDIQGDRFYYVVRGWGEYAKSILLDYGELYGTTRDVNGAPSEDVWEDLADLLQRTYDELPIVSAFVDTSDGNITQRAYEFCRENPYNAVAAKGRAPMQERLRRSNVEVNPRGKKKKHGLSLWLFNADYFKAFVHERIGRSITAKGAWLLPEEITENYCRQIVAEVQMKQPNGSSKFVVVSKANHFLDCEAMAAAAAIAQNAEGLREYKRPPKEKEISATEGWSQFSAAINGT